MSNKAAEHHRKAQHHGRAARHREEAAKLHETGKPDAAPHPGHLARGNQEPAAHLAAEAAEDYIVLDPPLV